MHFGHLLEQPFLDKRGYSKVGLMRSKKKQGFRGLFIEEGTQERFVGAGRNTSKAAKSAYKAGKLRSVGSVAPRPFAKQAESATLGAGRGSFLKYMKDALEWVVDKNVPAKPKKKRG